MGTWICGDGHRAAVDWLCGQGEGVDVFHAAEVDAISVFNAAEESLNSTGLAEDIVSHAIVPKINGVKIRICGHFEFLRRNVFYGENNSAAEAERAIASPAFGDLLAHKLKTYIPAVAASFISFFHRESFRDLF
jgi:hypothetical protein